MRFKLILDVNRKAFGDVLPINYQYEQSAVIYKILSSASEEYSSWLHDNGFQLPNGKRFKLFTYSPFKIEQREILNEGRLKINCDQVEWQISFLPEKSTEKFIQGIFANQTFEVGDKRSVVQFIVRSVEVMPEPEYKDEMEFSTMSGVCIKFNEESGRTTYLSPEDPRFVNGLITGLLSKYNAYNDTPYVGKLYCDFKLLNTPKPKLITIKAGTSQESKIKGYLFRCRIKVPIEFMKIIYDGGMGELCSQGFGCMKINNPSTTL